MTRSPLLIGIAALALVLAAGALVLQFVLPGSGDGVSRSDFSALQAQVASIKTSGSGLKVGFVNVDNAFTVFFNAVTDLRQRSTDKTAEISKLQADYDSGTVSAEQYQKQSTVLNTELLDANIALYASVLDRMIASNAFSDLRRDLQTVREKVDDLLNASKNLVSMVKGGAVSATEFQLRVGQAQSSYASLEKIVNQACAVKIQAAAQKVSIQKGFDLVALQKNVVLYSNPATVTDLTDFVKTEIQGYL